MDNHRSRQDKRKLLGPKRSATSLDNFLSPGVLFRFPSDFFNSKMPATFVSACSPSPSGPNAFVNIETSMLESFICNLSRKEDNSQIIGSEESVSNSGNSFRSMSPLSSTSSGDNTIVPQSQMKSLASKRKRCKSCGTRKTPYWRDGWGIGIALCNACGIRFHKYRKVCEECHCIAKKDEKGRLHCPKYLISFKFKEKKL